MDKRVMGSGKDAPTDDPSFMKVVRHFLHTPKPDAPDADKQDKPKATPRKRAKPAPKRRKDG